MNEPHDDDWYEKFKKKNDDLRQRLRSLTESVRRLTQRLREMNADMILDTLEGHPEKQQEFIEKLYNPFYTPTPVEEIVIQRLLKKEKDGQDL